MTELLFVMIVLGLLLSLLPPVIFQHTTRSRQTVCKNNLKGIGIGVLLYSQSYRFFPHMIGANQAHSPDLIPRVYETLIYLKYNDNPEGFVCPASDDEPIWLVESVRDEPRTMSLASGNSGGAGGDPDIAPVHRGRATAIIDHQNISYTYLKTQASPSTQPASLIIAGDKDIRVSADLEKSMKRVPRSSGNHNHLVCALHADAHVSVVRRQNRLVARQMVNQLVFEGSRTKHILDTNPEILFEEQ